MFLCSKWYLEKKFVISHLELEFYLEDTVDWGKKLLVNFNAEKTQLDSFDWSSNIDAIDKKMDGPVPVVEIIFLRSWGCLSPLNWIVTLTLSHLLKLEP